MSVIVTEMDMPERCGECKFKIYDRDGDHYECKITGEISSWGIGHTKEYCPLKSIDGLIEKITQLPTQENAEGQDMFQAYDVVRTIKEYCEVKA